MGQFGIGQAVKRVEDVRLLRGEGRFHNDVNLPGQAHAAIVRSPHAHARIRSLDTAAARRAPGVLAVFTGADIARDGLGTMRMTLQRKRPDGSPMFAPPHRGLTTDRVRHVGDPIALVIAETAAQARDAADLVQVDYDPLPSVTSTAAVGTGSPAVWDECPDNISNVYETGDKAATAAAFARADHVVRRRYVITRVHAQYMEPRGALGSYDPGEDRYTLYADVQYPHRVRNALASMIFQVPEHQIRVVAGDIGGAFGTKGWQYAEHRLVLWAARKLRRPVKWACERLEALMADEHARDNISEAELALDRDGRFLALRVRTTANIGAYLSSDRNLLATFLNVGTLTGVYAIPAAHVQVTCVLTNTNPTAPYRGAGRPESTYVIERLIDDAARELGMDADKVIAKGTKIAARLLEAAEADIVFSGGRFSVAGTDRAVTLRDVARAAFQVATLPPGVEPGLYETGTFSPAADTFPNGCHVCELEIDPETGEIALLNYVIVDDVGTVINPLTLEGQIHGGVLQGVGQALMEQVVYDPESGQLLTASFMEYCMPRAATMCDIAVERNSVPTRLNPLGAKGAGEAGTVGALPAVINAVMNSLAAVGVREFDMPATSERVWQALRAVKSS